MMQVLCCFAQTSVLGKDELLCKQADEYWEKGAYRIALVQYQSALAVNPNHLRANYMTGLCYLKSVQRERCLNYFLRVYEIEPGFTVKGLDMPSDLLPDLQFLCGYAYQLAENYERAREHLRFYKMQISRDRTTGPAPANKTEAMRLIDRHLYELVIANELMQFPVSLKKQCLDSLNSPYPDYAPCFSTSLNAMVFTSRRFPPNEDPNDSTAREKVRLEPDGLPNADIYMAVKLKDSLWAKPIPVPGLSTSENETSLSVSPDGNTLLLLKDDRAGDIFISLNKKGYWSRPKNAGSNINSKYRENGACLSPNGRFMIFASNRPGGQGGMDLYISERNADDGWGPAKNLGSGINSIWDEDYPAINNEGNKLFYCSSGLQGMGGYDIFCAKRNAKGNFEAAANMGYPLNSTDNDIQFSLTHDSLVGFMATYKEKCPGESDIVQVTFGSGYHVFSTPADSLSRLRAATARLHKKLDVIRVNNLNHKERSEEEEIRLTDKRPSPVKLEITVVDVTDGHILQAEVSFTDRKTGKVFKGIKQKNEAYRYDFGFTKATELMLSVHSEGYTFKQILLTVPSMSSGEQPVIARRLEMDKIKMNKALILRNVYFDFAKATLKKESEQELQVVADFMKGNPSVLVEIAGHTDYVGSAAHNLKLSKQRAEEVVKWLTKHGVHPSRLIPKGYGKTRPLASNDDELEGRELNRRTEFVILGNKTR